MGIFSRKPKTHTPTQHAPDHPSATTGSARQRQSSKDDGPETHSTRKKEAEDKANASKNNTGQWAALGIGAAAAAAMTAAALAAFVASDGATISFTNIQPETNADTWVPGFIADIFTSSNLEIAWKVKTPGSPVGIPSAVRVLKGDTIDISGVPELKINGTTVKVVKVKDDSTFVVESKMSDVSKISIQNKGEGVIHTSFEDQLDQTVADTAGGIANTLGKTAGNFMSHLGTFFFIFAICVGLYFAVQAFSKKE